MTSLVPKPHLQHAGDAAPERAGQRAAQQRHDHGEAERQAGDGAPQRQRGGGDAADGDLALAAHVGEVGADGEDEAEADQRQRHGAVDRGADGEGRAEGAVAEGLDRVGHRLAAGARSAAGRSPSSRRRRRRESTAPSSRRRSRQRASASAVMRPAPTSGRRWRSRSPVLGRPLAHQAAAVEHDDAVGDGDQLVELARDQQHADAAARGGADLAIDRLDRADVEAARRLGGEQRPPADRASARAPARPSAGCRRTGRRRRPRGRRRARRIAPSARAAAAFSAPPLQQAEAREAVELVQEQVLGHATWR